MISQSHDEKSLARVVGGREFTRSRQPSAGSLDDRSEEEPPPMKMIMCRQLQPLKQLKHQQQQPPDKSSREDSSKTSRRMMQSLRFVLFCKLVFIIDEIFRLARATTTQASSIRSNQGNEYTKFRRRTCNSGYRNNSKTSTRNIVLLPLCPLLLLLLASISRLEMASCQLASNQLSAGNNNEQGTFNDNGALIAPLPEAQPLLYMPFNAEFGSGDSPSGATRDRPQSSSSSSTDQPALDGSNDISSSLIEAKCWNNYQNDNDCKHLNFITQQQQQQPAEGQRDKVNNEGEEEDNIITPTVIFEASSSVAPEPDVESAFVNLGASNGGRPSWRLADPTDGTTPNSGQVLLAPPYYSSSTPTPAPRRGPQQQTANEVYSAPPASATLLPPSRGPAPGETDTYGGAAAGQADDDDNNQDRYSGSAVTRPSVTNPRLFVATPQPARGKGPKTTTSGRRCRDENDADCDEPDEASSSSSSSSSDRVAKGDSDSDDDDSDDSGDDDTEKDTADEGDDNSVDSARASDQLESGSGNGPALNPNDPDGESGPDDDSNELEGSGVGAGGGPTTMQPVAGRPPFTTVTTEPAGPIAVGSPSAATTGQPSPPDSTVDSAFVQKPTAIINVFVHSDLPPNIPLATKRPQLETTDDPMMMTTSTTTPAPTSTMADDTVTVKPIFPSTTMGPAADGQDSPVSSASADSNRSPDNRTSELDNNDIMQPQRHHHHHQQQANTTPTPARDSKLDQFMPVPLPKNERWRPPTPRPNPAGPPLASDNYNAAFNPWSTKRPTTPTPLGANGDVQFAGPNGPAAGDESAAPIGGSSPQANRPPAVGQLQQSKSEKNSYLLLMSIIYGAVVVLILIVLVFGFVLFINWNRAKASRQAFLQAQKAQLLHNGHHNGGLPPHLVPSMSHASQLVLGQQQQQQPQPSQQPGLLSTYAPGRGLTGGKVTTSLVKPTTAQPGADGDDEEDEDGSPPPPPLPGELGDESSHLINGKPSSNSDADEDDENGRFDSSNNNNNMRQMMNNRQQHHHQSRMINNNNNNQSASWSTCEDQTTSNSGGSQRTQDSQLQDQLNENFSVPTMAAGQQQVRSHYPSSLSDGRQNSSSISDSQCSPDGAMGQQPAARQQSMDQLEQQMGLHHPQQQQQPPYQTRGPQPPMMSNGFGRPGPIGQQPMMMMMPNQQQFDGLLGKQSRFSDMESSSSFDSIRQQQPSGSHHIGLPDPATMQLVGGRQAPPPTQQHHHHPSINQFPIQRDPSFAVGQPPMPQPGGPVNNIRHQLSYHQNTHQMMMMQQQQQQPLGNVISPQKIALNPLATLGRRAGGQAAAAAGLNRNIYSEDSSSFMTTTSPSLARTSSSSSFAFNFNSNNQLTGVGPPQPRQPPPPVGPKPRLDASGRIINDYSQPASFANGNGGAGHSVAGRQDRGEAWFV